MILVSREFNDEAGKRIKREIDDYINTTKLTAQMGMRQTLIPGPGTLNTITPCAACKLLRRRCAEDCPFVPYFSPHEPFKFAAVHKIFGASNVSKLLMVCYAISYLYMSVIKFIKVSLYVVLIYLGSA